MGKITYLLGAGASCNALPMVKDFSDRLVSFYEVLRPHITKTYGNPGGPFPDEYLLPPRGTFAKDLMESIAWLGREAKRHASIDTYAKKLFIRNDSEAQENLHKLKATLSCYLLLEQSINEVDKRYDSFFASTLTRKPDKVPSLPNAVNIVTWNYDTQLEKSYEEFCEHPTFVYEGITTRPSVIRLNGVCCLQDNAKMRNLGHAVFSRSFFQSVLNLFEGYTRNAAGFRPSISFAWETNDLDARVNTAIKKTKTLVIIGYSLPYFNRDIDKALFEMMVPSLEKIYIQAPQSDHSGLQERFLTLCTDLSLKKALRRKIEMLSGTDLFYIPDTMPR